MDIVQKLLIAVIVSLTVLLAIVGIQVILIMNDLRRAVKRLNNILDDSIIGGGLLRPEKLTSVLEFFRKRKKVEKHGDGEA